MAVAEASNSAGGEPRRERRAHVIGPNAAAAITVAQPTDADALPPELQQFVDWLAAQGYHIDDQRFRLRYPATPWAPLRTFNNRHVTCTHGDCIIWLLLDSGTWWRVLIRGATFVREGYEPALWQAWLTPDGPPIAELSLAEEVAFIRTTLPRIEAAIAAHSDLETLLWRTYLLRRPRPTPAMLQRWGFGTITEESSILKRWVERWEQARQSAAEAELPRDTFHPPAEVERVWATLTAAGFRRDESYSPSSFGDRMAHFSHGPLIVRFYSSMGDWLMDIWGEGLRYPYDAPVWWHCLDPTEGVAEPEEPAKEYGGTADRLVRDARWLEQAWPAIEAALADPEACEACLQRRAPPGYRRA